MNDCERIKAACRAAGWDVDNVAVDGDGDWWAYSHKESDDVCLGSEAMLRADINGAFAGFRFPRIPAPDPTPHGSGFRVGQRVERLRKCDDGSMSVVYSGVITGMDDRSVDVGDYYSVTWSEVKAGLLRAVPECPETERAPEPEPTECADDDCHAPATSRWEGKGYCEYCHHRHSYESRVLEDGFMALAVYMEDGHGIEPPPDPIHDDDTNALDALPGWEP